MIPPQQRLRADHLFSLHLRLIPQHELLVFNPLAHLVFKLRPRVHRRLKLRRKEADRPTSVALGLKHRDIRLLQNLGRVFVALPEHRDTHAGCAHAHPVRECIGLAQSCQNLFSHCFCMRARFLRASA